MRWLCGLSLPLLLLQQLFVDSQRELRVNFTDVADVTLRNACGMETVHYPLAPRGSVVCAIASIEPIRQHVVGTGSSGKARKSRRLVRDFDDHYCVT